MPLLYKETKIARQCLASRLIEVNFSVCPFDSVIMTKFNILISGLAITSFLSCPYAAKAAAASIDYFPLAPNYWWKYKTSASGVAGTSDVKVASVQKAGDGSQVFDVQWAPSKSKPGARYKSEEWYSTQGDWIFSVKYKMAPSGQMQVHEPPRKFMKKDPAVGDFWTNTGTNTKKETFVESCQVQSEEEVLVPAGKFNTLRVFSEVTRGGPPILKTIWYAAGVGVVKTYSKADSVVTKTELTSYHTTK